MSIAYLLTGILGGSITALASLWLGHSAGQALINYTLIGNLCVMLALAYIWKSEPSEINPEV